MKKIVIVASGPSLENVHVTDISEVRSYDCDLLVVNGASDWVSNFNMFFTLDPSKKNMARIGHALPTVDYYVAEDKKRVRALPKHVTPLIRIADLAANETDYKYMSDEWWLAKWKCKLGLSDSLPNIHTGNSAYGALGLAYLLGYSKILLLGVDGNNLNRTNGEGRPEFNLNHLPLLFASSIPQLKNKNVTVVNGSARSKITCFDRVSPHEGLNWIMSE